MEISKPSQAYVALSISYWSNEDVIEWATQGLSKSADDQDLELLKEIAWLNSKQKLQVDKAGKFLESYISEKGSDFEFFKYEEDAKQMLSNRIQQYLNGECPPYGLCQMVSPIEHCFDSPNWLGDLYNSCDWCEPNSHHSDFRHLEQTAKEVLNAL